MGVRIGIRREDKSVWERRVPLIPPDVAELTQGRDLEVWVQPSEVRVYPDQAFERAGALIVEDLSPCPVVFGVKEMPPNVFRPHHTYVFFAHVVKGQPYNMRMLARLLELGCHLIDYEKVTDEDGRRLIFFGRHAGLAGMIDTLCALGRRLDWEGIANPFSSVQPAHRYADLDHAREAISAVGARISRDGLPPSITPLICGFAGYGNVFRGANEIIELLPVEAIEPASVAAVAQAASPNRDVVYRAVFEEQHTVEPVAPGGHFGLLDYYEHPERYRSNFACYLPHLTVLVNCIYWEPRYPRLVTKADLRRLFYADGDVPRLRVIGDISCDIEGAIECTVKSTEPGNPVFVYDPRADRAVDGVAGQGPVVMAVDILPSEIPREASDYFSGVLTSYVPAIATADYELPFAELALPAEIKRAVIVYQGRLTPEYTYLQEFLQNMDATHMRA
jgi:alpha-aminoadipic semialdehyde synthase